MLLSIVRHQLCFESYTFHKSVMFVLYLFVGNTIHSNCPQSPAESAMQTANSAFFLFYLHKFFLRDGTDAA